MRKQTKVIQIGKEKIGGGNEILIQSMTNTDTCNIVSTLTQIRELQEAGCDLVRIAIKDREAALCISEIKKQTEVPLIADIHFDYRLALMAIEQGIDKLRINPGNIGEGVREVAQSAKRHGIPIRVGVNSGSLDKDILEKHGRVTAEGLVESAERQVKQLEQFDFEDIVISIKDSNVRRCVEAYTEIATRCDYPLHIGITEAGTPRSGIVKSSIGIGALLLNGIGDTFRVSLTASPIEEVIISKEILKALGVKKYGIEVIACPTCGRTEIDLIKLANQVEDKCQSIKKNLTIAVMGCVVNGPGEAREADLGIAGGRGAGILFKKGVKLRTVKEDELLTELMKEIESY